MKVRHHIPVRPLATAIATALLAPTTWAQESVNLSDVVVTAAGHEQNVRDAPASISVISREELERRAYRDVTDALRGIPGVIVTGAGNNADISLRGMPSQYSLILVDGRRQGTREVHPRGSAGYQQDWLPPLSAIERIEVIRGPMSTLYGSDAIGGVINIITRRVAQEWHGNVRVESTLQQSSDSGNEHQGQIHLSGPLVDSLLGLQVTGMYSHRQEDEVANGYQERDMENLTARLTLTPGDDHDFALESGFQRQDRLARPNYTLAPDEDASENEFERHYVSLSHTGRWGGATSDSYVQQETATNKNNEIEITNTVANTSWVVPMADHIFTLGAHARREQLDDPTSVASETSRLTRSSWAVFIEDEWLLTDTFALTGGVRLDDDEEYGSHVSPRLYGVWSAAPEWTIKGGVSTGYRAPNLREMTPGWVTGSRGGDMYGNPDLGPETSINKELGVLYHGPQGIEASLTLFHNDFEDKIARAFDECPLEICGGDPTGTYRINMDEAVTKGVEASLAMPLSETLALSASYTYTDSEVTEGEYAGLPLVQVPEHLASLRFDWATSDRLDSWVQATYRGREMEQPGGAGGGASPRAPSYTFVDAGGSYRLTDQTQLLFGLYNLLDKDVTHDEYGYVEDGRRLWVGLNVDF